MEIEKAQISKHFGKVLKKERTIRNISHVELENLSGITRKHIYNLEKGIHEPTLSNVFKLASSLEMKPTDLISALEKEIFKD